MVRDLSETLTVILLSTLRVHLCYVSANGEHSEIVDLVLGLYASALKNAEEKTLTF